MRGILANSIVLSESALMQFLHLNGWELVALLYFAGIGLVLLEVFLPGLILGVVGLAALLLSCYVAYLEAGWLAGLGMFAASCLGSFFGVITAFNFLPKTPVARNWIPTTAITAVSNPNPDVRVGESGVALTQLRPVGTATISGKRYDVESITGLIEPGAKLRVVRIEGARILVAAE
jgi:membrane-bound serine protease (ClpP class)